MKFTIPHPCGHTTEHKSRREQTPEMRAAFIASEQEKPCRWCRARQKRAKQRLAEKHRQRYHLYFQLNLLATVHLHLQAPLTAMELPPAQQRYVRMKARQLGRYEWCATEVKGQALGGELMAPKLLLEIESHHGDDGPTWRPEDLKSKLVSYFENAHGEQWVFLYDGKTHQAELYGGDCGWKPERVRDGRVGIMLDEAEQLWLRACWTAATERYVRP